MSLFHLMNNDRLGLNHGENLGISSRKSPCVLRVNPFFFLPQIFNKKSKGHYSQIVITKLNVIITEQVTR